MDAKLQEIFDKYYYTKCETLLHKYFQDNYPPEVWTTLKKHMDNGIINIINKECWSENFPEGGSNNVYLMKEILKPLTHEVKIKYFNTTGAFQLGDVLAKLYMYNSLGVKEVHIRDVSAFIYMMVLMQSRQVYGIMDEHNFHRLAAYHVCRMVQTMYAALTNTKEILKTKFIMHMPSWAQAVAYINPIYRLVNEYNNTVTKKFQVNIGFEIMDAYIYNYINYSLINVSQYVFQLRNGIERPEIRYYIPYVTPLEDFIVTSEEVSKFDNERLKLIYDNGIPYAIDRIIKGGYKPHIARLKELIEASDPTNIVSYPLSNRKRIVKDNTWAVDRMREKYPDYKSCIIKETLIKTDYWKPMLVPAASIEIDVDKYLFNNATKTQEHQINALQTMYSNAQEINAFRASFQTMEEDMPLLVTLKCSDEAMQAKLESKIKNIDTILKNNHLHEYLHVFEKGE